MVYDMERQRELGRKIRETRLRAGDSQVQLAFKMNRAVSTIRSWERGETMMRTGDIARFCRAYGLSSDEFLGI